MKCVCSRDVLEYALASAERFTGKNINLPVLGSILLEAGDQGIVLTATNLESAFHASVPAKVQSKGNVSVPAKTLYQYIQSVQEDMIELEEKNKNLVVKTQSREGKINGFNPEDFPIIPKIKKTHAFSVPIHELTPALEKVISSASLSEFKPELNGVFFKVSQTEYVIAATDTFRLAEKRIKHSGAKDGEMISFILPTKIAQEITRVFGSDSKDIQFSIGENQIEITNGGVKIFSRLIEGVFPEYSAIVPKTFGTSLYIPKQEFIQTIRSSSIFSSKLQDVKIDISQKKLEVSSENTEVGLAHASIPVESTGKTVSIHFNHRFLMDGMVGITEEDFFFGANDASTPALIRNKRDGSFTYVIMPIRLT